VLYNGKYNKRKYDDPRGLLQLSGTTKKAVMAIFIITVNALNQFIVLSRICYNSAMNR